MDDGGEGGEGGEGGGDSGGDSGSISGDAGSVGVSGSASASASISGDSTGGGNDAGNIGSDTGSVGVSGTASAGDTGANVGDDSTGGVTGVDDTSGISMGLAALAAQNEAQDAMGQIGVNLASPNSPNLGFASPQAAINDAFGQLGFNQATIAQEDEANISAMMTNTQNFNLPTAPAVPADTAPTDAELGITSNPNNPTGKTGFTAAETAANAAQDAAQDAELGLTAPPSMTDEEAQNAVTSMNLTGLVSPAPPNAPSPFGQIASFQGPVSAATTPGPPGMTAAQAQAAADAMADEQDSQAAMNQTATNLATQSTQAAALAAQLGIPTGPAAPTGKGGIGSDAAAAPGPADAADLSDAVGTALGTLSAIPAPSMPAQAAIPGTTSIGPDGVAVTGVGAFGNAGLGIGVAPGINANTPGIGTSQDANFGSIAGIASSALGNAMGTSLGVNGNLGAQATNGVATGPTDGISGVGAFGTAGPGIGNIAAGISTTGPGIASPADASFGNISGFAQSANPPAAAIPASSLSAPMDAQTAQDEADMAAANAKAVALGLQNPDGSPGPNAESTSENANAAVANQTSSLGQPNNSPTATPTAPPGPVSFGFQGFSQSPTGVVGVAAPPASQEADPASLAVTSPVAPPGPVGPTAAENAALPSDEDVDAQQVAEEAAKGKTPTPPQAVVSPTPTQPEETVSPPIVDSPLAKETLADFNNQIAAHQAAAQAAANPGFGSNLGFTAGGGLFQMTPQDHTLAALYPSMVQPAPAAPRLPTNPLGLSNAQLAQWWQQNVH